MTKILTISGSLRKTSTNKTLLKTVARLAPVSVEVIIYDGIGLLPHFNPDLEAQEPVSVTDFRAELKRADGVLISSPEYAHGVPGVLKNALDWLVGSSEMVGKPVALLNASSGSTYAQESLAETLRTMAALLVSESCVAINLRGKKLTDEEVAMNPEMAEVLTRALEGFIKAIQIQKVGID